MGIAGNIIKGTGKILGGTAKIATKGIGEIVGGIADMAGKEKLADFSREVGDFGGEMIGEVVKGAGNIAGNVVDVAIDVSSEVGGALGGAIAEVSGASNDGIEFSKNAGKIIGGAASGLLVGNVIGSAVTGITAISGTASTGTAISTLSGVAGTNATLAAIGGGSMAAGGAGMAGGQAVLGAISSTTAVVGGVQGVNKSRVGNLPKQQLLQYTPEVTYSPPQKKKRGKLIVLILIGIVSIVGFIMAKKDNDELDNYYAPVEKVRYYYAPAGGGEYELIQNATD